MLLHRDAHNDMSDWCRMFFETFSKEKKMHKEFLARSKAVAEAAEKAAIALRAAEEARRLFETDFGEAPPPSSANKKKRTSSPPPAATESTKKAKKASSDNEEEDDEEAKKRILRGIQKFVGADSGEPITAMPYKVFSRLNADTDVDAIPVERFHTKNPVTIKVLRDAKKRKGETLAPKEWDNYKQKVMERCILAGRIASFTVFYKENRKYILANNINKSELWKQYNDAWDALCGAVLKRVPNPSSSDAAQKKKKQKKAAPEEDSLETVVDDTNKDTAATHDNDGDEEASDNDEAKKPAVADEEEADDEEDAAGDE